MKWARTAVAGVAGDGSPGRPCASGLAALAGNRLALPRDFLPDLARWAREARRTGRRRSSSPASSLLTGRPWTSAARSPAAAGGCYPWKLGINRGAKADTLELLGRRLDEIYDGRPVLVVGWSLGGMFARELAHR